MEILSVVDLVLNTINGNVRREVFKYRIHLKQFGKSNLPDVSTFALGLDHLGNTKLPSTNDKELLLDVLEPQNKCLSDLNWAIKGQLDIIFGLDNAGSLPVDSKEWNNFPRPRNLHFRETPLAEKPYVIDSMTGDWIEPCKEKTSTRNEYCTSKLTKAVHSIDMPLELKTRARRTTGSKGF